jgi:hypothetical protein
MSLLNHIQRLRDDHRRLDKQISLMEHSGAFDTADVDHLKKKKLALKDEIAALEKQQSKKDAQGF